MAVFADVCSDADNKRMVDTAVKQFGGLNVAFINAGIVTEVTLSQVTSGPFRHTAIMQLYDHWHATRRSHFTKLHLCMHALITTGD
jgi:NAD(P)-dependent dehydrogenase (short-subunit alcohol dehydrogenase family)